MGEKFFTGEGMPKGFHRYFTNCHKIPRQPNEIRKDIKKLKSKYNPQLTRLEMELNQACSWMFQYQSCLLLWRDKVISEDLKC